MSRRPRFFDLRVCRVMLLAACLTTPCSAQSQSDSEIHRDILSQLTPHQNELWQEFVTQQAELEAFYGNAQIGATEMVKGYRADDPNLKSVTRQVYRAHDNRYYRFDDERVSSDDGKPTGAYSVTVARPEGTGMVSRKSREEPFRVVYTRPSPPARHSLRQQQRFSFLNAPFLVDGRDCQEYMLRPFRDVTTHRIADVEEGEEAGRHTVCVTIEVASPKATDKVAMTFLRDGKWAVKRYRRDISGVNGEDHITNFGEFEYTGSPGEYPLLRSGKYWVDDNSEPIAKNWQKTFQIDRFDPGPAPLELFSPTVIAQQLGITDPLLAALPTADQPFRYPEGRHEAGELKYVDDIPVLTVAGSPEEIGRQIGVLAARPAKAFLQFPEELLRARELQDRKSALIEDGKKVLAHSPERYQREIRALIEAGEAGSDALTLFNTTDDLDRIGGCSSITVVGERSLPGGPLMARNLDYDFAPAYIQHYTLVTVYRPTGKFAFASIGFPGFVGVLSAMNEAGLTLAADDIRESADGSPSFSVDGTPMMLSFRRVMEECRTVEEAEQLLRSVKHTTYLSLAVCDKQQAVVLELTPQCVVARHPEHDVLVCTNHFRSPELAVSRECPRYEALSAGATETTYDVPKIWARLHKAGTNGTLQSMVFEPTSLRLHLSADGVPATSRPPKSIDLKELLISR